MKKRIISLGLVAIVFVFASGFTFYNAPAKKVVLFEGKFNNFLPFVENMINPCNGEAVDFSGDIHRTGKIIIYDDYTFHMKEHVNYQGISGVGQSTGDSYHLTGGWNRNLNGNVGVVYNFIKHVNIIHQGGSNFKSTENIHVTVNANGEIRVDRSAGSAECMGN